MKQPERPEVLAMIQGQIDGILRVIAAEQKALAFWRAALKRAKGGAK